MPDCSGFIPRPPNRSGCVTTSATSWPASWSWFRVGPANAAVPANTMRNRALRADEFRFFLLLLWLDLAQCLEAGQPVGEEDAVQMIDLVLDRPRQERIAFDLHRLAVSVESARHYLHVPLDLADVAGNRQTALQPDLFTLVLDHLGIDQHVQVGVGLDHRDAQPNPDLGGGQADTRGRDHGVDHVVDQLSDAAVD